MRTFIVDAFTDQPFSGNPAGVCILDNIEIDFLQYPPHRLGLIARELNQVETAFIVAKKERGHYYMRWFSARQHEVLHIWSISGLLLVEKTQNGLRLNFPQGKMDGFLEDEKLKGHPKLQPLSRATLRSIGEVRPHQMLGVDEDHIEHTSTCTSSNKLLVRLRSSDDVLAAKPNFSLMTRLDYGIEVRGIIITSLASSDHDDHDYVSRYFLPWADEDPATGSAHCVLAVYWSPILNKREHKARQMSERGGRINVEWREEEGRVLLEGGARVLLVADMKIEASSSLASISFILMVQLTKIVISEFETAIWPTAARSINMPRFNVNFDIDDLDDVEIDFSNQLAAPNKSRSISASKPKGGKDLLSMTLADRIGLNSPKPTQSPVMTKKNANPVVEPARKTITSTGGLTINPTFGSDSDSDDDWRTSAAKKKATVTKPTLQRRNSDDSLVDSSDGESFSVKAQRALQSKDQVKKNEPIPVKRASPIPDVKTTSGRFSAAQAQSSRFSKPAPSTISPAKPPQKAAAPADELTKTVDRFVRKTTPSSSEEEEAIHRPPPRTASLATSDVMKRVAVAPTTIGQNVNRFVKPAQVDAKSSDDNSLASSDEYSHLKATNFLISKKPAKISADYSSEDDVLHSSFDASEPERTSSPLVFNKAATITSSTLNNQTNKKEEPAKPIIDDDFIASLEADEIDFAALSGSFDQKTSDDDLENFYSSVEEPKFVRDKKKELDKYDFNLSLDRSSVDQDELDISLDMGKRIENSRMAKVSTAADFMRSSSHSTTEIQNSNGAPQISSAYAEYLAAMAPSPSSQPSSSHHSDTISISTRPAPGKLNLDPIISKVERPDITSSPESSPLSSTDRYHSGSGILERASGGDVNLFSSEASEPDDKETPAEVTPSDTPARRMSTSSVHQSTASLLSLASQVLTDKPTSTHLEVFQEVPKNQHTTMGEATQRERNDTLPPELTKTSCTTGTMTDDPLATLSTHPEAPQPFSYSGGYFLYPRREVVREVDEDKRHERDREEKMRRERKRRRRHERREKRRRRRKEKEKKRMEELEEEKKKRIEIEEVLRELVREVKSSRAVKKEERESSEEETEEESEEEESEEEESEEEESEEEESEEEEEEEESQEEEDSKEVEEEGEEKAVEENFEEESVQEESIEEKSIAEEEDSSEESEEPVEEGYEEESVEGSESNGEVSEEYEEEFEEEEVDVSDDFEEESIDEEPSPKKPQKKATPKKTPTKVPPKPITPSKHVTPSKPIVNVKKGVTPKPIQSTPLKEEKKQIGKGKENKERGREEKKVQKKRGEKEKTPRRDRLQESFDSDNSLTTDSSYSTSSSLTSLPFLSNRDLNEEMNQRSKDLDGYRSNVDSLTEGIKRIELQLAQLREAQSASLSLAIGSIKTGIAAVPRQLTSMPSLMPSPLLRFVESGRHTEAMRPTSTMEKREESYVQVSPRGLVAPLSLGNVPSLHESNASSDELAHFTSTSTSNRETSNLSDQQHRHAPPLNRYEPSSSHLQEPHILEATASRVLQETAAYAPAVLASNDMFKRHLFMVQSFVEHNRRQRQMMRPLWEENNPRGYEYTTLADTKEVKMMLEV
ncbi:hypothetical protein PROFUN_08339 [Planoprotostelium fungivorum]|uniref:DUF4614 domain-containing protein n=1 Tax=Planoprotostelium fungivorum TaxID=1890364 RepID=A0A2P6NI24_9EUKA|nr:hypothetical protein PROFUN_08339 [Planoprotostelium fungivorum]